MMRMAILSDLHLISPDDPLKEVHANRAHFARAWPSAKQMCRKIQEAAPDLVVSLGDLVDWYSKENRDFALEILDELKTPCLVTPGNHDFEMYPRLADGTIGHFLPAWECEDAATRGWRERGIELGNRLIDAGSTGILLVQSACSTVPPHTREWLNEALPEHERNLLLTHVPLDVPEIRNLLQTQYPRRDLKKYVQSGAPRLFERCLRHRIRAAFFGHLHFGGRLCVDGTAMYCLGLSVMAVERKYPQMGQAMILDLDGSEPQILSLEEC